MLQALYPVALDCKIRPGEFWHLSLDELMDRIDSFNRIKRAEFKLQMDQFFTLADVIGNRIAALFTEKGEVKQLFPWDAYPDIFENDRLEYEAWLQESELEAYKSRRMKQVLAFNSSFMEGGE